MDHKTRQLVERVVSDAPPLTNEQRERVSGVLARARMESDGALVSKPARLEVKP